MYKSGQFWDFLSCVFKINRSTLSRMITKYVEISGPIAYKNMEQDKRKHFKIKNNSKIMHCLGVFRKNGMIRNVHFHEGWCPPGSIQEGKRFCGNITCMNTIMRYPQSQMQFQLAVEPATLAQFLTSKTFAKW